MRRVTIRAVAAEAGVSIGTASKALNGQGKMRAETRERVTEVAERLGFAPNTLAQALLAGRSFTVGVITTDSFGRFSIPVMLGAEDALGVGQISVFMCDTRDEPDRERRYLDMLLSRQVDGLIVAGRRIEPRPSIGAGLGVPVLYGEWSEAWGRQAASLLLRSANGVDAIFCGSDQIARGVSDTLRLAGCRVPDDIAVVGYDNWNPMVLGVDPPLTSVDMCLENVGRAAAEHLLSALN